MRSFVCTDPISKVVYGPNVLQEKGLAELQNIQASKIVLVRTADVKTILYFNQCIKILGDLIVEIFDNVCAIVPALDPVICTQLHKHEPFSTLPG